jgi:hypothetical protein
MKNVWLITGALVLASCGQSDENVEDVSANETSASVQSSQQDEASVSTVPSGPALGYVSQHIWSVWGGSCTGAGPLLQGTYDPNRGQLIFRDGLLLQDSNKDNMKYSFEEKPDGSFTFRQLTYDTLLPDVLVTVLTENVSLVSGTRMKVAKSEITFTDEAIMDTSIEYANPKETPEYYNVTDRVNYEDRCA